VPQQTRIDFVFGSQPVRKLMTRLESSRLRAKVSGLAYHGVAGAIHLKRMTLIAARLVQRCLNTGFKQVDQWNRRFV
jgi:hypothetical protein